MFNEPTRRRHDATANLFHCLCAVLLTASSTAKLFAQANPQAPGAGPAPLAAVPGTAAKSKALEQVKQVFGLDLATTKTPQQKRPLGVTILKAGTDTANDPALKYSLLETAKDLAVAAGDDETALAAVEKLAAGYALEAGGDTMRISVCAALSKGSSDAALQKRLVPRLESVSQSRFEQDDFDNALRAADAALNAAKVAKDAKLHDSVAARADVIRKLKPVYTEVQRSQADLQKDPNNARANQICGRYYCFFKNRWSLGLPMLVLGQDAALKAQAEKEIAAPTTIDERLALADGWWEIGEREKGFPQDVIRLHASNCYRRILTPLTGLPAAKAQKRLAEAEASPLRALLPVGDGITAKICVVPKQKWDLDAAHRTQNFAVVVPQIAGGHGTLEIIVRNLDDNSADGGAHCALQDASGAVVWRLFGKEKGDRTFKQEVTSGTRWTIVLEDLDTTNGNGGDIDAWVVPE
jgi:hypothetical protein